MVLTSVISPAAGARSDVGAAAAAGGGSRLLGRRRQPRQFLIVGDHFAFADQQIGNLGTLLVDPDHRFPARHDKSGDPHQIGETGIGGFRNDDEGVALRFLLLRMGAVLKPVISGAQSRHHDHG